VLRAAISSAILRGQRDETVALVTEAIRYLPRSSSEVIPDPNPNDVT
jgi:hypothetical protein